MFEIISLMMAMTIHAAISCLVAVSVWNCGFDEDGRMRFKSRKAGYVFCVLMGISWIILPFIFGKKKSK